MKNKGVFLSHDERELYAYHTGMSSLKGLSLLTRLEVLNCTGNKLTSLEGLSILTNLKRLYCNYNHLTSLVGLSALINLRRLNCVNNHLISLDGLSVLTRLEELQCNINRLTSLEGLSSLINLRDLRYYGNPIGELEDLSGLSELEWVDSVGTNLPSDLCIATRDTATWKARTRYHARAREIRRIAVALLAIPRRITPEQRSVPRDVFTLLAQMVWRKK